IHCTLSGNTATAKATATVDGGGTASAFANAEGGGIYNNTDATLTLDHSTVKDKNDASATASGVNHSATAEGGGIVNSSGATLNLNHSSITGNTISGNTPDDVDNDGTLNPDHSTIGVLH